MSTDETMILADQFPPTEEYVFVPTLPRKVLRTAGRLTIAAITLATGAVIGSAISSVTHRGDDESYHTAIVIGDFPDTLPTGVSEHLDNATSVVDDVFRSTESKAHGLTSSVAEELLASGVVLNSDTLVTAGHALFNKYNAPLAGANECQSVEVAQYNPRNYANHFFGVNKFAASFLDDDNTHTPDVSIIPLPEGASVGTKPLEISPTAPHVGDKLYFVTYQPTANNKDRNPRLAYEPEATKLDKKLSAPAIYVGVYEDRVAANGFYHVVTGFKSYGETNDANSRPGASGGEVLNSKGQLVGIVDQATDDYVTAPNEMSNDNIKILSYSAQQKFSDSFVQPITEGLIKDLGNQVHRAKPCK